MTRDRCALAFLALFLLAPGQELMERLSHELGAPAPAASAARQSVQGDDRWLG